MVLSDLRVGVIGAGGRGDLVCFAHNPENGVHVVAGADPNERALAQFRELYGADAFVTKDYRELLEKADVDAVFVCSPDYLHEEHAVASLAAGKAVYLEKPMAISISGADRILRTAYETRSKLYAGHNMRHIGIVMKMKELVASGRIGEVKTGWCRHFVSYGGDAFFKDWHADRRYSTSLLLQKAAHDLDVLHWLCGGYTRRLTAFGGLTLYDRIADRHDPSERGDANIRLANWPPLSQKGLNPVIDVEDISMMQCVLDNGVFASYEQCHFTPDAWRNYTIIGTEGRIENFGGAPFGYIVRLWNRRCHYNEFGDEQYHFPIVRGKRGHDGADARIVDEFLRHVREDAKMTTSPIAGRQAVAAGCMAADSLRNDNMPREVPPVAPEIVAYFNALVTEPIAVRETSVAAR